MLIVLLSMLVSATASPLPQITTKAAAQREAKVSTLPCIDLAADRRPIAHVIEDLSAGLSS